VSSRLPDEAVGLILRSRKLGRPELCSDVVERWLRRLVSWHTADRELQDDLVQECHLYFLDVVYRWIEPMEPKAVRVGLETLMNRKILSTLRDNRTLVAAEKRAPRPKSSVLSDFTGVYARETRDRNSSPRQKQILDLFMEGYSTTEVAALLGCSRMFIKRARETMVT
jgi:DNA-directed RNA polymerase specialized sigma24 family protein